MNSRTILITVLFIVLQAGFCRAQPSADLKQSDTVYAHHDIRPGEYDEILITLNVPRIGSIEIPAVIFGETAYLPVKELFDFLKIRNNISPDLHLVEGFFIDPKSVYSIDKNKKLITFEGKKYELHPEDLIITETGMYIRSAIYGQVFGLNCQFSFRSLSVNLITTVELPALREMKLEAMRKNLSQLKGEKKADSTINRKFSLFKLGMFDWSVIAMQETNLLNNTRVTFGMGAEVLGGETDMFLNYYNDRKFKMKDQYYFWRYINNDNKAVKQVTLGKILANPSSTVYEGITGIQINNTPTTFRRSFGTYTLSDKTEPGWTVELYVNNVLVNFTRADASGFFTFEVPMVYGNSVIRLRFFGPWGEEKISEQNLSIPFNFLPEHRFEYNINAGIVADNAKSKFSRVQFSYGLNKRITVSAGMEYLSSLTNSVMPFANASFRVGSNIFLNGDYIRGVRTKAIASYRFHSGLRVELNYLHYDKDQKAILVDYLEEKKLVLSKSFHKDKYSVFTRFTLNQFSMSNSAKSSKYTSTEMLLSAVVFGISSNLTSYLIMNQKGIPLAYTNLSMNFHLHHGINILPQAQFEYNMKNFSLLKGEIEKSLFSRGFINISIERDMKNNQTIFGLGFRYNFSFMQTAFNTRRSKNLTTNTEVARGSLLADGRTGYAGLSNENNVGKGGIIVSAFLDLNNNGKKDKGEPCAPGLSLKINGGRIKRNDKDTTIRITNLDAYTSYYLELNKNSFDNISWQIKKPVIKITIDPNYFTYVEVPVSILGEVNGAVHLIDNNSSNGLGRMIVNIYNDESVLVARTITEGDGFFSYLGLSPGKYNVRIDADQLKKLNMESTPAFIPVTLKQTYEGDAATGMFFTLKYIKPIEKN